VVAKGPPVRKGPAVKAPPSTESAPRTAPTRASARPGAVRGVAQEEWSAAEIAEVREQLLAEEATLRRELDDAAEALDSVRRDGAEATGDDQADAGTATFEREHEMSLANNSRDLLVQTQRALQRLDSGTYGVCEICGDPIGKARLQAFPRATLCVRCKQREERR